MDIVTLYKKKVVKKDLSSLSIEEPLMSPTTDQIARSRATKLALDRNTLVVRSEQLTAQQAIH